MFPLTITITSADKIGETASYLVTLDNALNGRKPAGVSADEKTAVLVATESPPADTAEAPGKPKSEAKRLAAQTAPSQPTAGAAPSTPAPSAAAPEKKAESSDAPSTETPAAAPFAYDTLLKAVNAAAPKHGRAALLAIANKHGAPTFKELPASVWAAAHADVVALG